MKTIGIIDYYVSEWHADNYPRWIEKVNERLGEDFRIAYAWAEIDASPLDGRTTDDYCTKHNVEKCATIKEVCDKADYLMILAPSDPDKHLGYAEEVLKCGKLTYIDKTFAPDYKTAQKIFDIAEKYGTKFFSTSAFRFANELDNYNANCKSIFTTGGGSSVGEYIVHQAEMVTKTLGVGAIAVKAEAGGGQTVFTVKYPDDRMGTMLFSPEVSFNATIGNSEGVSKLIPITSDYFKNLMAEIMKFYNTGVVPFDGNETLEIMKIREAAIKAEKSVGNWIKI